MMTYTRSSDGKKIHLRSCRYASSLFPWWYADGFTAEQIKESIAEFGWLSACRVCKPGEVESVNRR